MRRDVVAAERREEVRRAARAWRRAGAIDEETLPVILASYPDDRSRVGPAFRVLLFLFTLIALAAAFMIFVVNDVPTEPLLFAAALAGAALTELQTGRWKRARTGSEEATAILAVLFSVAAVASALSESRGFLSEWRVVLFLTAIASAAAVWRWGFPIFGALAAASFLSMFLSWSGARLAWILLGVAALPALLAASLSPRLAPSQRRAADAALVTVLIAVYLAIHIRSYDLALLEELSLRSRPGEPATLARRFYIVATAVLPLVLLAWGIFWRRPLLLRMGLVFGIASLVTIRYYVHLAPLWAVLVASGAIALALATLMHRYLTLGRDGERRGFTADPLFEALGGAGALETGMAASLTPEAPPEETPVFRGGGGKFGGGGASGGY